MSVSVSVCVLHKGGVASHFRSRPRRCLRRCRQTGGTCARGSGGATLERRTHATSATSATGTGFRGSSGTKRLAVEVISVPLSRPWSAAVKVSSLTSTATELPFSYYSLPFCQPQGGGACSRLPSLCAHSAPVYHSHPYASCPTSKQSGCGGGPGRRPAQDGGEHRRAADGGPRGVQPVHLQHDGAGAQAHTVRGHCGREGGAPGSLGSARESSILLSTLVSYVECRRE